jgi:hypothetical protein
LKNRRKGHGASKPSAELFKRVFFEWLQSKSNGRQIGLTFQTFQMGKPFPNRVTNNGLFIVPRLKEQQFTRLKPTISFATATKVKRFVGCMKTNSNVSKINSVIGLQWRNCPAQKPNLSSK